MLLWDKSLLLSRFHKLQLDKLSLGEYEFKEDLLACACSPFIVFSHLGTNAPY